MNRTKKVIYSYFVIPEIKINIVQRSDHERAVGLYNNINRLVLALL